jgi:hypothetical protein
MGVVLNTPPGSCPRGLHVHKPVPPGSRATQLNLLGVKDEYLEVRYPVKFPERP